MPQWLGAEYGRRIVLDLLRLDRYTLCMRVLLLQLDGELPNIALMRIASHHRELGDDLELRHGAQFERCFWDNFDRVYASAIFTKTKPLIQRLLRVYPNAIVGGTGWDLPRTLESVGITTQRQDYSIYPNEERSVGFTQRGCRLRCSFCVVPEKEGAMRSEKGVLDIWRGPGYPRQLLLLDNDFFGQPGWRAQIDQIREYRFKVCFCQGINVRFIDDEAAAAIASIDYRANNMKTRRIYTAWDNLKDEERLFAGLNRLVKYGVKPRQIMVYMLIGYWPGETATDRDYRRAKLRDFGADPYPMPFTRTAELTGFQRWVVPGYDKRVPWDRWESNNYRPEGL